MESLLQLLLRSTLLCSFSFSCSGSSISYQDPIPSCMPENCCEIHWNQNGRKEKILFVSFLSSGGYTVNCSLNSVNDTFDDLGVHECTCVSESVNLPASSNSTRIFRATVSFQGVQSVSLREWRRLEARV
ncbi:hypothetical protein HOLleu_25273 [Holothuria leucospilota]|uniref:Uncharacterized protein n=1 Tax=Holothuria leucospilota TaxID=206669 RepID=A0A9Q1BSM2_HOLLE|nr:hypothetical protein HOLleu_25273 [Holothuria leucospilota]